MASNYTDCQRLEFYLYLIFKQLLWFGAFCSSLHQSQHSYAELWLVERECLHIYRCMILRQCNDKEADVVGFLDDFRKHKKINLKFFFATLHAFFNNFDSSYFLFPNLNFKSWMYKSIRSVHLAWMNCSVSIYRISLNNVPPWIVSPFLKKLST